MDRRSRHDPGQPFEFIIPIMRSVGFAMIVTGVFIMLGRIDMLAPEIGIFVAIFGILEMLIIPTILRKAQGRNRENSLAGNRPDDRPDSRD